MRLQGKVTLITGARSGIGRGIAQRFAREGALVVVDQARDGAEETASLIQDGDRDALGLQGDVSRSDSVQSVMRGVRDRWGRLDVLVNNAGILWAHRGDTPVTEVEEAVWDHVWRSTSGACSSAVSTASRLCRKAARS